jgi:hypothetical protein
MISEKLMHFEVFIRRKLPGMFGVATADARAADGS